MSTHATSAKTFSIRPEHPADAAAIRSVNDAAFGSPLESGIVDAVRNSDRWIDGGSLVAEAADRTLVGHLLLSRADLVETGGAIRPIWVVGPVAVEPDRQRRGIGAALMRAAIEAAIEHGQPLLCLLGHASYYPRFGFEPARPLGIEAPHAWPDESWLALRLPAWDATWRGTVRYPPAFPG